MESWMPFFVAVTALAVVLQTCILAALLLSVRSLIKRVEETTTEVRARVAPILSRVQIIVDEAHPQITQIMEDAALITTLARGQVQNVSVTHGLGLGLDERAIDAVRHWKFRPASRNGKPAVSSALVEVSFRLL